MTDAALNEHAFDETFVAGVADDPFRLKIQKGLTAAFKQITSNADSPRLNDADPFLMTVRTVGRGRLVYGSERALPLISILEEPFAYDEDLPPGAGRSGIQPYELIIQGFDAVKWTGLESEADDDDDVNERHPTDDAHKMLADVKRRLSALKLDESERFEFLSDPDNPSSEVVEKVGVFRFGTKYNSVVDVNWDGGVVRPPEEVGSTANFWLRVRFNVSEDHGRPTG